MTHKDLSHAMGNIHIHYIQEAATYFDKKKHPIVLRRIFVLAAILIGTLSLCAFTYGFFSTIAGDNLILTATYVGDGIVHANVENQSDKVMKFEPVINLLYYSNNTPVDTTGEAPVITGLTIPAKTKQTVRIDLRNAYDLDALEHIYNDFIILQLTNKGFAPGQKWRCIVSFRPRVGDYVPQYVTTSDLTRAENVLPSLKAYFENFTPDVFARWADIPEYLELVEQELSQVEGNIVVPVDPLYFWDFEEFDTLVMSSCFDGYNKLLGRTDMEKIKNISLSVPRLLDGEELDGTQQIPLFYFWCFSRNEIQSLDDYAFIRGNLITFSEMEAYKVYEDDSHVIYEMHHLVYSDLRNYVEEMLIQNDSIYFNEDIWERIQRFYNTYNDRDHLNSCIKTLEQHIDREPMDMDDVISISSRGREISFDNLKHYSGFWQDIDYTKGHGLSFRIDSDYELFYALEPNGTFKGYYLYYNPTEDYIDIRFEDVSAFVNTHGVPQPRCECTDTENGDHGWHLTLNWLINMNKETIISYISHICSYSVDTGDSHVVFYPLDDERFHVEIDWSITESGPPTENIWLVHDETQKRCNVRTDDINAFLSSHS